MAEARWLPRDHHRPAGRGRRLHQRQVQVQETWDDSPGSPRLNRLASLLSETLARRLGQVHPAAAEFPAAPLDYPAVVSPTTDAKSAVPTEEM